ncbi:MAG: hypothetical protein WA823_14485, partial [Candidatus Acidiferrales bacterium]
PGHTIVADQKHKGNMEGFKITLLYNRSISSLKGRNGKGRNGMTPIARAPITVSLIKAIVSTPAFAAGTKIA